MSIKIKRNEAGNCINFEGTSNPTYWNACLSGEVDSVEVNSVNVINDVITADTGNIEYEFFRIPYTTFVDADGNSFTDAQECADYITTHANVIGFTNDSGTDLTNEIVDFKLDATSTSILFDNGYHFGVNAIKAIPHTDGTIHIKAIQGDITYFTKLDHTNVTVEGQSVSGGLQDVVNTLNELFTVGAFQSVVISDPYSTMIADVDGVVTTELGGAQGTAIETGTDEYGATTGSYNGGGYKTPETINQAGEYFTFDIRNEGIIGFGLVPSDADYANGDFNGNSSYADPSTFCNAANSGHYGYQFSHWFHPSPNGPWTNYGANAAYSMRQGWSNANFAFSLSPEGAKWLAGDLVKIKVGIDENNFIVISYFDESTSLFVPIARTTYPVPNGLEYHLGVKFGDTTVRMVGLPKIHELEDLAPTMNFRYIESPDGVFHYPLFTTAEEAEYYDEIVNGLAEGAGSSHTHTYADDPTNTTWYMPEASHNIVTYQHSSAPDGTEIFSGNVVTYTEVTSLTDADLTPPQFSSSDYTYQEGTVVNLAVTPAGASWTTSVSITPSGSGLVYDGYSVIQGTLNNVSTDTLYTVSVTRANSYGSTIGTFEIQATDVVPATPISGFTIISSSNPLVDSDTLDDGSAVTLDDSIEDGYRFKMDDAYVTANILPNLQKADDKIYVGFAPDIVNGWGSITGGDFNCGFRFQYASANSITVIPVLAGSSGGTQRTHSYSSNLGYDFYLSNNNGVLEANYNLSSVDKTSEPTNEDGGSWTYTDTNSTASSGTKTIAIAATGTTADISVIGLSEHLIPAAPTTNLTPWTKALDFSGSNEHLKQVHNHIAYQPMKMNGYAQQIATPQTAGNTAHSVSARPWATTVIFKSDGHSSTQIIWNQGEGYSNGNDNIALKLSSTGSLLFQWGRQGTGVNECKILNNSVSSSHWYGVCIAHTGERLSGNNASASRLAACFDIRVMSSVDNFGSISSNLSTSSNWHYTGQRMDRTVDGDLTIGGINSTYQTYRGKIASMVVTTLKIDDPMPTAAEMELMISDPVKWVNDYKVGNSFRRPIASGNTANFLYNNGGSYAYIATQIWLMGDGTSDSYANGVRNQVLDYEQNYTRLQLNSMVSNDIENVNINGLT